MSFTVVGRTHLLWRPYRPCLSELALHLSMLVYLSIEACNWLLQRQRQQQQQHYPQPLCFAIPTSLPPPLLEPAPSPPLRFNCLFIAARRPFDSVDPAPLLAHQCVCGCVCVICGCCSWLMHYMNFNKLCILTDYPPPPFCPFRVCLL